MPLAQTKKNAVNISDFFDRGTFMAAWDLT